MENIDTKILEEIDKTLKEINVRQKIGEENHDINKV